MRSRSVRRRQHKTLARLREQTPSEHEAESTRRLLAWRREAYRRARSLDAPQVWGLANDPQIQAVVAVLDPGGGLQSELNWVCAQAVASEAGGFLVRGSRPTRDRARLLKPKPSVAS